MKKNIFLVSDMQSPLFFFFMVQRYHVKDNIYWFMNDSFLNSNYSFSLDYLEKKLNWKIYPLPKEEKEITKLLSDIVKPDFIYFHFITSSSSFCFYEFYKNHLDINFNLVEEGLASYDFIDQCERYAQLAKIDNYASKIDLKRISHFWLFSPELFLNKGLFSCKKIEIQPLFSDKDFITNLFLLFKIEDSDREDLLFHSQAVFLDQYLSGAQHGLLFEIEKYFMKETSLLFENEMMVKLHPFDINSNKYKNESFKIFKSSLPWEILFFVNFIYKEKEVKEPFFFLTYFSSSLLNTISLFGAKEGFYYIFNYHLVKDHLKTPIDARIIEKFKKNNPQLPLYIPETLEELSEIVSSLRKKEKETINYQKKERELLIEIVKDHNIIENHIMVSYIIFKTKNHPLYQNDKIKLSYSLFYGEAVDLTFLLTNEVIYNIHFSPFTGFQGTLSFNKVCFIDSEGEEKNFPLEDIQSNLDKISSHSFKVNKRNPFFNFYLKNNTRIFKTLKISFFLNFNFLDTFSFHSISSQEELLRISLEEKNTILREKEKILIDLQSKGIRKPLEKLFKKIKNRLIKK